MKKQKVVIYDIVNEDDDFLDLDKDDISAYLGKDKTKLEEGESLPMPIITSGFDYDDYNPKFLKGGRGGRGKRGGPQEVRYSSKRYGGHGAITLEEMANQKEDLLQNLDKNS